MRDKYGGGEIKKECQNLKLVRYTERLRQRGGTVDYLEQFCAISKVPMVLIKESTN